MHDDVLGNVSANGACLWTLDARSSDEEQTNPQALLLCFKLQESRVSVVSSTAAATLRQAVMLVFDRISPPPSHTSTGTTTGDYSLTVTLSTDPPTDIHLSPSMRDAFYILSDLCLLTASGGGGGVMGMGMWGGGEKEKPKLLKLASLQRTFGLELIESILSGYQDAVKGVSRHSRASERVVGFIQGNSKSHS